MAKKRSYLELTSFGDLQHLGLLEAEKDRRLAEYYVGREQYLSQALNFSHPAAVFVGPKGVGKSAILQMIRLDQAGDEGRIINISPDDLAFSALTNIDQTTPLLEDAGRHQHLYKTLWDYVLSIEIIKREFKDTNRIKEFFSTWTRSYDETLAHRLLKKTLSDEGDSVPLSARILALLSEVQATMSSGGVTGSISAKIAQDTTTRSQLSLLSLINEVVKTIVNKGVLHNSYYVLIDDLDLYYKNTELQQTFIGALLLSVRRLSQCDRLKFAVSLRDYIFEAVPIAEKDKFRDSVSVVEWDNRALKRILQERIRVLVHCPEEEVWRDLFPSGAFDQMLAHTTGMPRELLRLCSMVLATAKKNDRAVVSAEDVADAITAFSREQLSNLASEYSAVYPGLDLIAQIFSRYAIQMSFEQMEEVAFEVSDRVGEGRQGGQVFKWAAGAFEDPGAFAHTLLECGLLHIKDGRKAEPREFLPEIDRVGDQTYFAVPRIFAAGLGLTK